MKQAAWIIILYWSINLAIVIGVYVQDDATAKIDAVRWAIYAACIFVIAVLIQWYRNKKGIQ